MSRRRASSSPVGELRLAVDRIACDGYGVCGELLPELISLDDWGYPLLRPLPVPPELEPDARRALELCPKLALKLRAVEGNR